jgi:Flp pilus assembly protein TadD
MQRSRILLVLAAPLLVACSERCGPAPTTNDDGQLPAGAVHDHPQDEIARMLTRSVALFHDDEIDLAVAELDRLAALGVAEAERTTNRAIMLREQGRSAEALAAIPAATTDPRLRILLVELHFANGQPERAMEVLQELTADQPERLGLHYIYAQHLIFTDRAAEAATVMRAVLEQRPQSPQARVTLGEALLTAGQLDEALEVLNEVASGLDGGPAQLDKARAAMEQGDEALASNSLRIVVNLANADLLILADRTHLTADSKQDWVLRADGEAEAGGFEPPPIGFVEAGSVPLGAAEGGVHVLSDGTLIVPGAGQRVPIDDGKPGSPQPLPPEATKGVTGAAVGAVLKDDQRVWLMGSAAYRESDGKLVQISRGTEAWGADPMLLDVDKDSDPDLLFKDAEGELQLRLSSGEGPLFHPAVPLAPGTAVASYAALDADGDHNTDLLARTRGGEALLLRNQGHGRFHAVPLGGGHEAAAACAADLDRDGRQEPLLVREEVLVPKIAGQVIPPSAFTIGGASYPGGARKVTWAGPAPKEVRACGAEDLDGDGLPDLVLLTDGPLRVLRNDGEGFAEGWSSGGPVRSVAIFDADGDGDGDLATLDDRGDLHLFHNSAGDKAGWLTILFKITKDSKDGYGTRLLVDAGRHHATAQLLPTAGLLQRNLSRMRAPLAGRRAADRVAVTWPNEVWQQSLEGGPGEAILFQQDPGLVGSCPFLYAWDGARFSWVNDLLGNAPLGLPSGPGSFLPANPVEYTRIEPGSLQPRDGQFSFRLTDELREVTFVDQVALTWVDHPPGSSVFSNDGLVPPPYPEPIHYVVGELRSPDRATDHQGRDLREVLAQRDRRFAGATAMGPFPGMAERHHVDLTWDRWPGQDLALVINGSWFWGEASSYAGPQAMEWKSEPPRIYRVRDGIAEALDLRLPIPGGRPKWVVADLGERISKDLRPGDTLRIASNWQLYWDAAFLAPVLARRPFAEDQPASTAVLRVRGYSRAVERNDGPPPEFDYQQVEASRPFPRMPGWYTALGPVESLVAAADDTSITIGHGEELAIEFPLPDPPAAGAQRTWFFKAVGWDKDGDPKTAYGQILEPWPSLASQSYPPPVPPPAHPSRSRWVSGR